MPGTRRWRLLSDRNVGAYIPGAVLRRLQLAGAVVTRPAVVKPNRGEHCTHLGDGRGRACGPPWEFNARAYAVSDSQPRPRFSLLDEWQAELAYQRRAPMWACPCRHRCTCPSACRGDQNSIRSPEGPQGGLRNARQGLDAPAMEILASNIGSSS
jgi:hypothetical protein